MAKTTFILEAEEAKVVNAYLRVIDAQKRTADGMRAMNREGQRFSKDFYSGMLQIAGGVGMITAVPEAILKVIKLIGSELDDLRRKESEAAKATTNYAKNFSQTIGDWLGAENIDKAHAALTRLVKEVPEVGYTTGQAMLAAYGSRQPKAGLERGMEAVRMVAPLAYNREEIIALVGELEDVFPGKKLEDIFDIAIGLRKRAGEHREEIEPGIKAVHRMTAIGIPGEQALGVLMAALEEEQAGRAVQGFAALPLTLREKMPRTFKKMTEEEILNWALANPDKVKKALGPSWAPIASIMKPGLVGEWTKTVETIQTGDEYKKELEAQRESHLATTARIATRREAAVEGLKIGATPEAIIGFTRQATEDVLKSVPDIGALQRKRILAAIGIKGRVGGEYAEAAIERLTALQGEFATPTITVKPGDVIGGRILRQGEPSVTIPNRQYAPEVAEAISKLIRDIQEQATAFKGMGELDQDTKRTMEEHTKAMKEFTAALRENTQARKTPVYQSRPGSDE